MKKIAIIGTGISGLSTAYLLSKKHQVHVFEKAERIGGHTATVDVELDGSSYAIDTGFIVFNNVTYPNYLALLDEIGIEKQETEMSFSVRNLQTGLEYNGHNLNTLFAQRRNFLNPRFWFLIRDILRFNKQCKALAKSHAYSDELTLGEFLANNNFSSYFCEHYILPMGAAIWSTSLKEMEAFQFKFFVQFFHNHGLLNITDRPQWYVIPGGSRNYLAPLIESFKENIQLNADIKRVTRNDKEVTLELSSGELQYFDEVVFACHSDQALKLLGDASEQEEQILSSMPYSKNEVVLHTDINMLPKRKAAWASWNYQLSEDRARPASVTYNMNILQGLKDSPTFCVTLNQSEAIDKDKIIQSFVYEHPVFNLQSLSAQQRRSEICGHRNTHFVGAYWYNGFHEDGVRSAVDVAAKFDCFLKENSVEVSCASPAYA